MNEITTTIDPEAIEQLMLEGDLSRLTPNQRLQYYRMKCEAIGIDHTQTPFQYMRLSGKLTLYATKNCAEQLRMKHDVSIQNLEKEQMGDIFVVTVTASLPDGRQDTDLGTVATNGASGERLANCYLKAITKAKRRVTLSLLGLGMLDETEVETIPNAELMTEEEALTIETTADQKPLLETLQIDAEWNVDEAEVTKVTQRSYGDKTWWTVDIDHPAESFTTFSETYSKVAIDAYSENTKVTALLKVKKKRDGGKVFNCIDILPYVNKKEKGD